MKWLLALLFLSLSACSGLPKAMRNAPYTDINLNVVKTNISAYKGMPFRWGGTIINIKNKESSSLAQILFYPLTRYGRPYTERKTEGRFAISSSQFLDPAIYKEGGEITVTGVLSGEIKQKIGEKTLALPLIAIDQIHLWPIQQRYDNYYYPYSPYHPHYYFSNRYYRHGYYYDPY